MLTWIWKNLVLLYDSYFSDAISGHKLRRKNHICNVNLL